MLTVTALWVVIAAGLAYLVRLGLEIRHIKSKSCSELVRDLKYVNMTEICRAARVCDLGKQAAKLTNVELLENLDGLEGVKVLRQNAALIRDISRVLLFVMPSEHELVRVIRADAAMVERTAFMLYWGQVLHLHWLKLPAVLRTLARVYVSLSMNAAVICDKLRQELEPLSEASVSISARLDQASQTLLSRPV